MFNYNRTNTWQCSQVLAMSQDVAVTDGNWDEETEENL